MSEADDIRADFLTEAGELVQRLGGQLVELEGRPGDTALLNDIFRAFHTVKGGAGFLELAPLVELCHAAEDVFNLVRAGKRSVDAALLDAVLQAVDHVQAMMDAVAANVPLQAAPAALLQTLRQMTDEKAVAGCGLQVAEKQEAVAGCRLQVAEEATAEAEAALGKKRRKPAKKSAKKDEAAVAPAGDTISEDEFEALLDQLHGKGAPGAGSTNERENSLSPTHVGERVGVRGNAAGTESAPVPVAQTPHPSPLPTVVGRGSDPTAPTPAPAAETTVRVDTARLDKMMNLVGELVLVRNRLKDLRTRAVGAEQFARAIGELDFITRGLQNAVMQIRMQPIRKVFSRFPKIARDVARSLGKQVEVELVGEDTDLDKNLVEALADPLVHMVRNSVDHGIEMPEERLRRGKPAAGRLVLAAQQEGDHILIRVRDDGAGMDPERIRAKALEKGVLGAAEAAQLTPDECLQLVFLPGFSTKEQVSDLSGRGVGMDVVMSRIKALGGSAHIESRFGQGSTVLIRVPLTLAILSALMVHADGRQFALPLAPVLDIFELDPARVDKLDRWDVVLTRRDTLRLVYLDPWLSDPTGAAAAPRHVVVAQVGEERYGFVVREVRGREEIVIKPLGASLRGLAGISGATVLPDGRVALILDFSGLVDTYKRSLARPAAGVAHG